ncbi:MAG: hypothetical protein J1F20_00735 [Muribaculaceae bacterium]|nr:hypothetical protein [Muribaculaceae bacterium]
MNIKKLIYSSKINVIGLLLVMAVISSCQSQLREPDMSDEKVTFIGYLKEDAEVRSRTLDSVYINSTYQDLDFFVQLEWGTQKEFGIYEVSSAYEGRLNAKGTQDELNWKDLTTPHTFYSWTLPWNPEWDQTQGVPESFEIEFKNSSEGDDYNDALNNKVLERFIGAMSGPYSYANRGKYVDLTFFHLVSKIKIADLSLIETDGSIQRHLKADVTFINMPTKATFYPCPTEDQLANNQYAPKIRRPFVVPGEANLDDGITYFIDNDARDQTDVFYICPEIDFRELDYKIVLNNTEYANYKTYYGTFANVEFIREAGNDYDLGDEDKYILHAGEMMTLYISLIPGIGPGLRLIISDWSTDRPTEAEYHSQPGIYSDAEFNAFLDSFLNQTDYSQPPANIESLFEMYGKEGEDGNNYFQLFDDVFSNSNIFPVYKGYTIDGQGHTVFMKTNRGNYFPDRPGDHYYFNIGQCEDIYLKSESDNPQYGIYIDKNHCVWVLNADTGEYEQTEYKLDPFPLKDPYKGYDISAETGQVRPTDYYNNNITR